MQTLETLMLRLTTNVTVSPASSSRSSSAAWRISSMTSGRVSAEHRRQLRRAQRDALPPLLDRAGHQLGTDRRRGIGASGRAPDPRRGMKDQYLTLIVSITAGAIHSGSMYFG